MQSQTSAELHSVFLILRPVLSKPLICSILTVSRLVCSINHLRCAGLTQAPADPCSKESVLKVLKESRKREVEDEDQSFTTEQKSKRRYGAEKGLNVGAFDSLCVEFKTYFGHYLVWWGF